MKVTDAPGYVLENGWVYYAIAGEKKDCIKEHKAMYPDDKSHVGYYDTKLKMLFVKIRKRGEVD